MYITLCLLELQSARQSQSATLTANLQKGRTSPRWTTTVPLSVYSPLHFDKRTGCISFTLVLSEVCGSVLTL